LSTELQTLARKYINQTGNPIFITGKAGTGKTTFLKAIISNTHKNTVVAAPTGIAAINAGGVTLHSMFQLPFGIFLPDDKALRGREFSENITTPYTLISKSKLNSQKRKIIRKLDLLVIDEVSMLRADLLDAIDHVLRSVRKKMTEPFGGVQLLFIGDLLQLPPVVQRHEWPYLSPYYDSMFFFNAKVLQNTPPVYIEFDKIYRQTDNEFIELLNKFRNNTINDGDLDNINSHYDKNFSLKDQPGYIHITTHNRKADKINQERLDQIKESPKTFKATLSGDFGEHMFPADNSLVLKKEAQVMFIKNDPSGEGKFFNGKIGKISFIDDDEIIVSFPDGTEDITVTPYTWENKKYILNEDKQEIEEKTVGTFMQYPLKLAWAITVHKSQGLTFEKAVLDLSDTFISGQMYVALSRLTSLKGLVLAAPIPDSQFKNDPSLVGYIHENQEKKLTEEDLKMATQSYFKDFTKKSFLFDDMIREFLQHKQSYDKSEINSIKQKQLPWASEVLSELLPFKDVSEKFCRQIENILERDKINGLENLIERVKKARNYFNPLLTEVAKKIQTHIDTISVQKGTKTYVKELKELKGVIYQQFLQMKKAEALLGSAIKKTEFEKESLYQVESPMEEQLRSTITKKVKSDTRLASFEIYKKTGSIAETAKTRGMVYSTIESHLTVYVKSGELNVLDFVQKDKLENILVVIDTLKETGLTKIKEKLGDDYTYSEIKFALAHFQSIENKN